MKSIVDILMDFKDQILIPRCIKEMYLEIDAKNRNEVHYFKDYDNKEVSGALSADLLNYFYNFIMIMDDKDIEVIVITYHKSVGFKIAILSNRVTDNKYSTLAVKDKEDECGSTVIIVLGDINISKARNRLFDIERYFFPTKVKYLSNQLSQLY